MYVCINYTQKHKNLNENFVLLKEEKATRPTLNK